VYRSETEVVIEMETIRLSIWEREIFRKMYGLALVQGIWRIRGNQALRELYRELDIAAEIKKKRLARIRHLVRMNQGRTVKRISRSKEDESKKGEGLELDG